MKINKKIKNKRLNIRKSNMDKWLSDAINFFMTPRSDSQNQTTDFAIAL
ncbi:MAG: hypothetical protein IJ834_06570 [Paludibacteraceae bacterium]|nr:hypothetical protein [Paludibacteraceae bacterium]